MDLTTRPATSRTSLAVLALVTLLAGMLPGAGAGADTGPRGTGNVCDPPFERTFADIDGSVHEQSILCMAELGLTVGTGDGSTFSPDATVTRGQMATFVAAFVEQHTGEELPEAAGSFDDVSDDSVHASAIHKLHAAGITTGIGGSNGEVFAPHDEVTRGQLASFLARAATYIADGEARPETQPPRSDQRHFSDHAGSVHSDNIDALAAVGVLSGFVDGSFGPHLPAVRAQLATFVVHVYDWAVEVSLGQRGAVSGTVTDADTDAAIGGASVVLDDGTDHAATTGDDGGYLLTGVEPGTYTLTATATGYDDVSETDLVIEPGETVALDLALDPTPTPAPEPDPDPVVNESTGEGYQTLVAAVDASTGGDVLRVNEDVDNEELVEVPHGLTIYGADAAGTVTVSGAGFLLESGSHAVTVEDLTFAPNVDGDRWGDEAGNRYFWTEEQGGLTVEFDNVTVDAAVEVAGDPAVFIGTNAGDEQLTITNSSLTWSNDDGSAVAYTVYALGDGVTVTDTSFGDGAELAIGLESNQYSTGELSATIEDNVFTGYTNDGGLALGAIVVDSADPDITINGEAFAHDSDSDAVDTVYGAFNDANDADPAGDLNAKFIGFTSFDRP